MNIIQNEVLSKIASFANAHNSASVTLDGTDMLADYLGMLAGALGSAMP